MAGFVFSSQSNLQALQIEMKITMKKVIPMLAVLFLMLPSVSFAAALTQQQANSLIAVVQSSPNTPASFFVPLITSFSNITVNQAASLISVVQTAPSVPASAFVNLLISFTVDTSTTAVVTPTGTTQPIHTDQQAIQAVLPIASGIVVWNGRGQTYVNNYIADGEALASDVGSNCGQSFISVGVLDQFGNYMQNQPVTFTNPETGVQTTRSEYVTTSSESPLQEPAAIFSYSPQIATGTESILLTSANVSRTVVLPVISVGPIDAQNEWKQESATE